MKLQSPITLEQVANYLGAPFVGDPNLEISGLNEIHKIGPGDLTFVDFHKYYDRALQSEAWVVLINADVPCPIGKGLIISDDPFRDYNLLVKRYLNYTFPEPNAFYVHQTSIIHPSAKIGYQAYIGPNVTIGENAIIHPHVTIYRDTIIGNDVIIHANTIIGADAFYFKKRTTGYDKLISCGRVIIHDEVEIGASCTIDAGVSGDTIIGKGTKLDNQVHVGHGVVIGQNCLFAAQVGIGGKTIIQDEVTLWGQVGVQKDLLIEKGAVVLGQSGVSKSLKGNRVYFGSPAGDAKVRYKELTYLKKLPEFIEQSGYLNKKLGEDLE